MLRMAASAALWQMVAGGKSTVDFVRLKAKEMSGPGRDGARIRAYLAQPKEIGLRLHREVKILRIVDAKGTDSLRFKLENLYPEYVALPRARADRQ